jgi:hypothetical protein
MTARLNEKNEMAYQMSRYERVPNQRSRWARASVHLTLLERVAATVIMAAAVCDRIAEDFGNDIRELGAASTSVQVFPRLSGVVPGIFAIEHLPLF